MLFSPIWVPHGKYMCILQPLLIIDLILLNIEGYVFLVNIR